MRGSKPFISSVRLVLVLVICSEALHIRRKISVSVKYDGQLRKLEKKNFFQDASHLCTFCARAVVRIDQFVVFCCWLVLFVCTWLLFSSFFDTCHAQNTPGVGMELVYLLCAGSCAY